MGDGCDFELLTVLSSAVSTLTASKVTQVANRPREKVTLTANYGDVNFTYDGTTPTSVNGMSLQEGGTVKLTGVNNLKNLKLISLSGTSKVAVTYELTPGGY